jgi:hypothetical protein
MLLKLRQPFGRCHHALYMEAAIRVKIDPVKAPVCGANLVLRANRFLQQILLYMYCLSRQRSLIAHLIPQRIEPLQKPNSKSGAGAQTGAGRQVRNVMNLDPLANPQMLKAGAHGWMLDCIVRSDVFEPCIRNSAMVLEKWRQPSAGNKAGLVDRRREHRATVLAVPDGIVSASAEKRNTEWGS